MRPVRGVEHKQVVVRPVRLLQLPIHYGELLQPCLRLVCYHHNQGLLIVDRKQLVVQQLVVRPVRVEHKQVIDQQQLVVRPVRLLQLPIPYGELLLHHQLMEQVQQVLLQQRLAQRGVRPISWLHSAKGLEPSPLTLALSL